MHVDDSAVALEQLEEGLTQTTLSLNCWKGRKGSQMEFAIMTINIHPHSRCHYLPFPSTIAYGLTRNNQHEPSYGHPRQTMIGEQELARSE
jgi:hypothetical protein